MTLAELQALHDLPFIDLFKRALEGAGGPTSYVVVGQGQLPVVKGR